MTKRIVSDTGPIISLEKLSNGFEFIRKLYDKIIIPQAVLSELSADSFEYPAEYLDFYSIKDLRMVRHVREISELAEIQRLDEGEKQAISLAHQLGLPLLIEETIGRHVASSAGIPISGIAGQIVKSFKLEIISGKEASRKLGELYDSGRINRRILNLLISAIR